MKSLSIILAVTEEADYLRETAEAARSACVDCGAEAELLVVTPTPYLQRAEDALRHIDDIQICPVETNSLALLNNYGRAFASSSCARAFCSMPQGCVRCRMPSHRVRRSALLDHSPTVPFMSGST